MDAGTLPIDVISDRLLGWVIHDPEVALVESVV